jgi:hypothetical protein
MGIFHEMKLERLGGSESSRNAAKRSITEFSDVESIFEQLIQQPSAYALEQLLDGTGLTTEADLGLGQSPGRDQINGQVSLTVVEQRNARLRHAAAQMLTEAASDLLGQKISGQQLQLKLMIILSAVQPASRAQ